MIRTRIGYKATPTEVGITIRQQPLQSSIGAIPNLIPPQNIGATLRSITQSYQESLQYLRKRPSKIGQTASQSTQIVKRPSKLSRKPTRQLYRRSSLESLTRSIRQRDISEQRAFNKYQDIRGSRATRRQIKRQKT